VQSDGVHGPSRVIPSTLPQAACSFRRPPSSTTAAWRLSSARSQTSSSPTAPPCPAYPDGTATQEGRRQRDEYWGWFARHWNADTAGKVIEEVIGTGGRPRWMTFDAGDPLHLHVVARGDYDTGVFAYNLVRRGQRYGLRIVGSLKSQPSLNVLALYEK
jgi:hypothetical protein